MTKAKCSSDWRFVKPQNERSSRWLKTMRVWQVINDRKDFHIRTWLTPSGLSSLHNPYPRVKRQTIHVIGKFAKGSLPRPQQDGSQSSASSTKEKREAESSFQSLRVLEKNISPCMKCLRSHRMHISSKTIWAKNVIYACIVLHSRSSYSFKTFLSFSGTLDVLLETPLF